MKPKLGDRVKYGVSIVGEICATRGEANICLIRTPSGYVTSWLPMSEVTILPPEKKEDEE